MRRCLSAMSRLGISRLTLPFPHPRFAPFFGPRSRAALPLNSRYSFHCWLCPGWAGTRSLQHKELLLKSRDPPGLRFSRGLFLTEQKSQFAQLQIQFGDGALAVVQAGVEFTFAQGEDVGANFQGLLPFGGGRSRGLEFELGAAASFLEGL
jgi:hypothetical protein